MAGPRRRLDQAVVELGLAPTREKARALILAGRVLVDGQRHDKPGRSVPGDARIELRPGDRPFVSRGGLKLDGVLDRLGLAPDGWHCLDVGASTGGFTDVLLRRGARHVTALDVGRGLIDDRLRRDPRVTVIEGVNARHLVAAQVEPPYDLATIDVSFISLTLVLPAVLPLAPSGAVLALVKPQFELTRREVPRGGVVRDPEARSRAVVRVIGCLETLGWGVDGIARSPVAGPKGNREVFVLARPGEVLTERAWRRRVAEEIEREDE